MNRTTLIFVLFLSILLTAFCFIKKEKVSKKQIYKDNVPVNTTIYSDAYSIVFDSTSQTDKQKLTSLGVKRYEDWRKSVAKNAPLLNLSGCGYELYYINPDSVVKVTTLFPVRGVYCEMNSHGYILTSQSSVCFQQNTPWHHIDSIFKSCKISSYQFELGSYLVQLPTLDADSIVSLSDKLASDKMVKSISNILTNNFPVPKH